MLSTIIALVLFNPYIVYSENCEYRSKTCRYRALIKENKIQLDQLNSTIDSSWRTVTSTLYCGKNDCLRELHVTLGESVTWTRGKELSYQEGISNAIIDSLSTGSTTTISGNAGVNIFGITIGGGVEKQFHKSNTRESSLETSFSRGTSVTYSLSKEYSLNKEEAVTCSAKANEGVKLLARTNELHIEAFLCIPDRDKNDEGWYPAYCEYIRIVMRPFSGNSISADIKCSTENSEATEPSEPQQNACSTFDDTCDLNKPCCSNLSCVKSDPTWALGRCYNTNNHDTQQLQHSNPGNTNCIPFDGVCSHGDTCCGNTYCYYGNPSWANGRCYNRN